MKTNIPGVEENDLQNHTAHRDSLRLTEDIDRPMLISSKVDTITRFYSGFSSSKSSLVENRCCDRREVRSYQPVVQNACTRQQVHSSSLVIHSKAAVKMLSCRIKSFGSVENENKIRSCQITRQMSPGSFIQGLLTTERPSALAQEADPLLVQHRNGDSWISPIRQSGRWWNTPLLSCGWCRVDSMLPYGSDGHSVAVFVPDPSIISPAWSGLPTQHALP